MTNENGEGREKKSYYPEWPKHVYKTEMLPGETPAAATERVSGVGHTEFLIWPAGQLGQGAPVVSQMDTTARKERIERENAEKAEKGEDGE